MVVGASFGSEVASVVFVPRALSDHVLLLLPLYCLPAYTTLCSLS